MIAASIIVLVTGCGPTPKNVDAAVASRGWTLVRRPQAIECGGLDADLDAKTGAALALTFQRWRPPALWNARTHRMFRIVDPNDIAAAIPTPAQWDAYVAREKAKKRIVIMEPQWGLPAAEQGALAVMFAAYLRRRQPRLQIVAVAPAGWPLDQDADFVLAGQLQASSGNAELLLWDVAGRFSYGGYEQFEKPATEQKALAALDRLMDFLDDWNE
jgi:hypothetical protein